MPFIEYIENHFTVKCYYTSKHTLENTLEIEQKLPRPIVLLTITQLTRASMHVDSFYVVIIILMQN